MMFLYIIYLYISFSQNDVLHQLTDLMICLIYAESKLSKTNLISSILLDRSNLPSKSNLKNLPRYVKYLQASYLSS